MIYLILPSKYLVTPLQSDVGTKSFVGNRNHLRIISRNYWYLVFVFRNFLEKFCDKIKEFSAVCNCKYTVARILSIGQAS